MPISSLWGRTLRHGVLNSWLVRLNQMVREFSHACHWPQITLTVPSPDYLHNPDPIRDRKSDHGTIFTIRGLANLGFLFILGAGILTLLYVHAHGPRCSSCSKFYSGGYPMISYFQTRKPSTLGGYNLGGTNGSGQVPEMHNHATLIDPDTPDSALHWTSNEDKSKWDLVFSDEFNTEGRSFYPVCYTACLLSP